MMKKRSLNPGFGRRQFIKGVTAGALTPFIPMVGAREARAQGDVVRPSNVVLVWWPNGLEVPWIPSDTLGTDFPLTETLAPVERHRQDMLMIHGLKGVSDNEILQHMIATPGVWTGAPGTATAMPAGFPSVDQLIAREISQNTIFPSLQLGLQSNGTVANTTVTIFSENGDPMPNEENPVVAFDRIFGASTGDPTAIQQRRAVRGSVFDLVTDQLDRLEFAYGGEDLARIHQHQQALREIETRLDALGSLSCDTSTYGGPGDLGIPATASAMQDLIVLSLKCGITRVASLQYFDSISLAMIPGVNDFPHHGVMHTGTREEMMRINMWYIGQFAELLDKMKAVTFEDGRTLLDDTLIVFGTEMAIGNHLNAPIPHFIAGGGDYFKLGQFYKFSEAPRNTRFLVEILHAMGLTHINEIGAFRGEGERGPLPELRRFS